MKSTAVLSACCLVLTSAGCGPGARGRVLRTLFDGVPDESAGRTVKACVPSRQAPADEDAAAPVKRAAPKVFFHEPFVEQMCDSCHESKYSQRLTQKGKELCFSCHEDFTREKKTIHYPVSEDMCLECHQPHQSANKGLLKDEVPAVCWGCHDDFSKQKGVKVIHPPVAEGACLQCHNTHASGNERLLTEPVPAICFTCHDEKSVKEQPQHEDQDNCLECHQAHVSENERLLK